MRQETVFVISTPARDLEEFAATAEAAAPLRRFGRVEVNVAALAGKARHELPPGGSGWHEYAAYNPTPAKFFPHERIAPFLPAEFVQRNRALLLAKSRILQEKGLGAAFWSYEPNFLPEEFFQAYPHLRGPRVDHPRRSRREAFAPCMDHPQMQEMVASMMADLARNVPDLGTYYFKTNDAGSGLCWSDWQYSGPNGPGRCRCRGMGRRVGALLEALQRGARQGGADLAVHFSGNFSRAEIDDIDHHLPPRCYLRGRHEASLHVGSMADRCYPVRGILEPLDILESLQPLRDGRGRTVFLDFRTFFDRGSEDLPTVRRMLSLVEDFLARPAYGLVAMLQRLQEHCRAWAGPANAEALFEALVDLHEAMKYQRAALPRLRTIYCGVSLRFINRPLVAIPARLTDCEQDYFLPFIFNVSRAAAADDYLDLHGGRLLLCASAVSEGGRVHAIDEAVGRLRGVAQRLADLGQGPETAYFARMGQSLRAYASLLRSVGNFHLVQAIRDRRADDLSRPRPLRPGSACRGDEDLLNLNGALRDELDNAQELLDILNDGGMDRVLHAASSDDEDTFLLGPDLPAQIARKRDIMRAHWLDAQEYLEPPN